ncbi:uncharacterized protein LOC115630410 isoform X1 [Scaptodrosophila lebanonensis]|uniref:Uncharacterized protein LOC115630410 isoform X1 n=1 Tax=Drosophila lebanonensis TaxID=7225 RepID=A0A6J2U4F0_DROLE|nr:uncharacterized protein LOC115630410 isoform X1 [Scaptodrosophila lebanonensis]
MDDMYRLSYAFLQGNENINAFADKQGAVQVLVKELTGIDLTRRFDAAECFCNFSLGEAHVCEKIATLAGTYLVTYMDIKEPRLKRSCLWTLANILSTSNKATTTLLQMQLVPKLWKLYTAPADDLNVYQEDAAICLYLIATSAADLLSSEDRRYIAEHVHEKCASGPASEYYMHIIFQTEILRLEQELCLRNSKNLLSFVETCLQGDFKTPTEKFKVIYAVRVFTNIVATFTCIDNAKLIKNLVETLKRLFALQDESLTMDLLRLVKNIMNLQQSDKLLDHLQVHAFGSMQLYI